MSSKACWTPPKGAGDGACVDHGRARARWIAHRRRAGRAGRGGGGPGRPVARAPRQPGLGTGQRRRPRGRGRHPRSRARRAAHGGHRRRLPPGGDPHHAVRGGAAAGARGAGRRHATTCSRRRCGPACARSWPRRRPPSYGQADAFPTDEDHHPYNNDTIYGAAKVFNEGMLRSFHEMYGLDYVALRYFNVYGPRMDIHGVYTEVLVRWMERIAAGKPPLILGDGSQTMDFVYVADIARANLLAAAVPTSPTTSSTSPAATETSLAELARALLEVMGADLEPRARSRTRGEQRWRRRLADTTRRAERCSASRAQVDLEEGLRGLVAWWWPSAADRGRSDVEHGRHRTSRSRSCGRGSATGGAAGASPTCSPRAGSPRARRSPRSRRRWRRARRGARRRRRRRARPRCTSRCIVLGIGPRRRGRRAVVVVHRDRQRGPLRRRDAGLRRRRPRGTQNLTPQTIEARCSAERTRAVIVVHQAGVPADVDAIQRALRPARHRGRSRTRRARSARRTDGAPGRRRRELVRVLVPPAQADHHRRGRHGAHDRRRPGARGCAGCASTA